MLHRSTSKHLFLIAALAALTGAIACSSPAETKPAPKSGKSSPVKKTITCLTSCGNGSDNVEAPDIDNTPVPDPDPKKPSPTTAWCQAAAGTDVASQSLSSLFGTLCSSGLGTAFLVNELIPNAYSGSGEVQPVEVQPVTAANKTITAFYAIAIKMPIAVTDHYTRVAPSDGDQATEIAKITAEGPKPGAVTITPVASSSDAGWKRGWLIDAPSSVKSTITIQTGYAYQQDHYQLGTGLYLYASSFKQPSPASSAVKNYQVLTAAFDLDGAGYQVIVAKISADDKGQPQKITEQVKATASKFFKFQYDQSAR